MLFHVTMTHTEDNCPAYHREMGPEVMASFENIETIGKELNIKIHSFVWSAPNHTAFALLEAGSMSALSRFVFSIPIPQDFKVLPVERMEDTVKMAKLVLEQS